MKQAERAIAAILLTFAAIGSIVAESAAVRRIGMFCGFFAFLLLCSLPKNNILPFRRPPKK